jgi:tetratricopeptide (TPR) repeat protein
MIKEKFIFLLFFFFSLAINAQEEKAFDFYSAGVRAGYSYDFGVAIYNYSEAIKIKPDYMMAYFNRGAMFIKTREFDNTIKDMQEVLTLDSTYYDAYIYLGEAYIGKSDIEQAKKMYEIVLRKIPSHKKALSGIALCFFYQYKFKESISAYDKYLSIVKEDADAFYKRGLAKFSMDDYTGSINDFSRCIDLKKDFWQAYDARAKSYRFDANLMKACEDWNTSMLLGSTEATKNIETYCNK